MRVFLSWSGDRSKAVAEFLRDWLKMLIQATEPWISLDIDKGDRWSRELSDRLEESRVGVICLTPENLTAPWILFEAGALAKTKGSSACTLLIGVKPADVQYPLAQFQHTLVERDDIRKLVHTINDAVASNGGTAVDKQALDSLFDMLWPKLEERLASVMAIPVPDSPPARNTEDMLDELLINTRAQDVRMHLMLELLHDLKAVGRRYGGDRDFWNRDLSAWALTEKQREELLTAQLEGRGTAYLAGVLGISEATVRRRIERGELPGPLTLASLASLLSGSPGKATAPGDSGGQE